MRSGKGQRKTTSLAFFAELVVEVTRTFVFKALQTDPLCVVDNGFHFIQVRGDGGENRIHKSGTQGPQVTLPSRGFLPRQKYHPWDSCSFFA
jgi:hypothetical protein